MSLLGSTFKNIGIVATFRIITVFLGAITTIALARLLIPEYFGIIAITMFIYMSIDTLAEFGMGTAIIQRKKDVDEAMNTAFTIRVILSTILFVIFISIAPFYAAFYGIPEVAYVMWFVSITMLIANFGFAPRIKLQKTLQFKKLAVPEISRHLTYAISSISLALLGFGYWSLAAGVVLSTLVNTIVLNVVQPVKIKISLNRKTGLELIHFGKFVLGSALIIFAITNLDDAISGKLYGPVMLGFYVMAWRWANLPGTHITYIFTRVMFPTYSTIQDDKEQLSKAYIITLKYVSILTVPIAFGLITISPQFTRYVLGENWIGATLALQILCYYGLARSLFGIPGSILKAIGKPKIEFKLTALNFIILLILFLVLYPLGIEGIALAMSIATSGVCIAMIYYAGKAINTHSSEIARSLFPSFLAGFFMIGSILLILFSGLFYITNIWLLLILIAFASIVYFISIYFIDKNSIKEIIGIIRKKGK